jgi:hypothetical protein
MAVAIDGETILCRILGRYKIYVDSHDWGISPHLMLDGVWEIRTTEVVVDLLLPGMTAIDVGANLGYFTLLMAGLCGPSGRCSRSSPIQMSRAGSPAAWG